MHHRQKSELTNTAIDPRLQAVADLNVVLRRYGFLGLDSAASSVRDDGWIECRIKTRTGRPVTCMIAAPGSADATEASRRFLFDPSRKRWF
ncbi:MAG: hypothetical protein FJX57_12550, partial [Alphaproteobacteria bacterium]|nr:hypothetical protein [Alphaproteobacteria bacterium]